MGTRRFHPPGEVIVRKRTSLAGCAAVVAAAATLAPGLVPGLASAGTPSPTSAGTGDAPIKHVIEIMIENHTFDNLFGSFPGADGIPAGTSLLNPNAYYDSAPNVSPVWAGPNEGACWRPGVPMARSGYGTRARRRRPRRSARWPGIQPGPNGRGTCPASRMPRPAGACRPFGCPSRSRTGFSWPQPYPVPAWWR
jgi:hypothetical protein